MKKNETRIREAVMQAAESYGKREADSGQPKPSLGMLRLEYEIFKRLTSLNESEKMSFSEAYHRDSAAHWCISQLVITAFKDEKSKRYWTKRDYKLIERIKDKAVQWAMRRASNYWIGTSLNSWDPSYHSDDYIYARLISGLPKQDRDRFLTIWQHTPAIRELMNNCMESEYNRQIKALA